ncbi:S8 family peptidase [Streptomyces buecherae]|uniref:S8 family peptidase n=1 Tax=Streptomyces buecherae TaxID=2763006 RepID=UPI00365815FA
MTKKTLPRSAVMAAAACALVLPLIGPAPAAGADTPARAGDTGVYVVHLLRTDATPEAVRAAAERLVADAGGQLRRTYHAALQGFSVTLTEAQVGAYLKDTRVGSVTRDRAYRVAGALDTRPHRGRVAPWGLDRMDQRDLPLDGTYTAPNSAPDVPVYVVDTGVRGSHEELRGRVTAAYDAIRDRAGGWATDCHGHGTATASLVAGARSGVAKQARIASVRALGCDGTGRLEHLVSAVDWISAHAPKPALASLGFSGEPGSVLDLQLYEMADQGIAYTAPAGNGDADGQPVDACDATPGRQTTALTVSATDQADRRMAAANTGSCVHLFAPGAGIPVASGLGDRYYTRLSGTSASAAQVAGVAATYLYEHPDTSATDLDAALARAATPDRVQDPGADTRNLLAYVGPTDAATGRGPAPADRTGAAEARTGQR